MKSMLATIVIAVAMSTLTQYYMGNLDALFKTHKIVEAKSYCQSMKDMGYFEWEKTNTGKVFFDNELKHIYWQCDPEF